MFKPWYPEKRANSSERSKRYRTRHYPRDYLVHHEMLVLWNMFERYCFIGSPTGNCRLRFKHFRLQLANSHFSFPISNSRNFFADLRCRVERLLGSIFPAIKLNFADQDYHFLFFLAHLVDLHILGFFCGRGEESGCCWVLFSDSLRFSDVSVRLNSHIFHVVVGILLLSLSLVVFCVEGRV